MTCPFMALNLRLEVSLRKPNRQACSVGAIIVDLQVRVASS